MKKKWLYKDQFQNRRHKQLTIVRTRGVTALDRSVSKQLRSFLLQSETQRRSDKKKDADRSV
jgi:hypothetical protein